ELKDPNNPNGKGDSAVTLYWEPKDVPPKQSRVVGFAYGLGSVSGEGSGALGLATGGEPGAGKGVSLTADVKHPVPGQTVKLTLPAGMALVSGKDREDVPAGGGGYSTVSWRVRADRNGVFNVKLSSSTGGTVSHRVPVQPAAGVFKK